MTRRAAKPLAGLLLALLLPAPAALAQNSAAAQKTSRDTLEQLRPSGPITVKADRAEWVQNDTMKYVGNVSMDSSSLIVRGDSMDVKQAADGQFEAWIHGAPATLDHAADPKAGGAAAQAVHAEAKEIHYDSRTGTVDMSGGARLKRGADEVTGETIGYIVPERRIRAASGGNGQVTITFQPPPPKSETPAAGTNPGPRP